MALSFKSPGILGSFSKVQRAAWGADDKDFLWQSGKGPPLTNLAGSGGGKGLPQGLGWGTSEERLTYALSSCSLFFLLMILNLVVRPKTQALFLSHRPCPFQGSMSRAGVLYKGNVSPNPQGMFGHVQRHSGWSELEGGCDWQLVGRSQEA